MKEETKRKIRIFAVAIAIPLAVGILSALFTRDNMSIYSEINTPPLSPPSWLFPAVWTVLYVLMGVSSALVWLDARVYPKEARSGLFTYAVSLVFNFFWSIVFFNLRAYLFAFIWLVVLLVLIIKTVFHYKKVSPPAAWLQIPYIIWVAFAGYLNLAIFILN